MSRRTGAGIVAVAALLLYLPSLHNGFAWDDNPIIRLDARIHEASALWRVFVQPYWASAEIGLYRPLTSFTYAVDWLLSGGSAAWFHMGNVLWNAAACVLLFLLLCSLVQAPLALLGALLFAAHPVHTEAVANIVGRAELMAACFGLGAMIAWQRSSGVPRSGRSVAAITGLYVLALLSKESAVMLPALFALLDVATGSLRPRTLGSWLREHAREIGALGGAALVFLLVRSAVIGSLAPTLVDPILDVTTTPQHRIMTALQAWPVIVRLLFYPRVLLADYGPGILLPATAPTPLVLLGASILLALLGGGAAAWLAGRGRTACALLFVPCALLPISNVIVPIGVIVAERALYLPSVALALAFAFGVQPFWHRTQARHAAVAAASVATLIGAARTVARIPDWSSTTSIMAALERDRPDAYRPHWYFAQRAVNLAYPDSALQRYARALSIWPYREPLTREAAAYAAAVGDLDMAERITSFAVQRWPDHVEFLKIHAAIQIERGRTEAAGVTLAHALRLAPGDPLLTDMYDALGSTRDE